VRSTASSNCGQNPKLTNEAKYLKARALGPLAAVSALAGQHQLAETMARTITYPSLRGRALADVATALALAGVTRSASRLAAETCTLSDWPTAARPVLLLDPPAFTALTLLLQEQ
jgi:hypothetical protein